jgi:hypothetical protein
VLEKRLFCAEEEFVPAVPQKAKKRILVQPKDILQLAQAAFPHRMY